MDDDTFEEQTAIARGLFFGYANYREVYGPGRDDFMAMFDGPMGYYEFTISSSGRVKLIIYNHRTLMDVKRIYETELANPHSIEEIMKLSELRI